MKKSLLSVFRENTKLLNSLLFFICWSQIHAHSNAMYFGDYTRKSVPVGELGNVKNVQYHHVEKIIPENEGTTHGMVDSQETTSDKKINVSHPIAAGYPYKSSFTNIRQYGSDSKEGTIGTDAEHPVDHVYDNIFHILVDDKINVGSQFILEYDLYGITSYDSVSKVINDDLAKGGGKDIEHNKVWTHQYEPLRQESIKKGMNTIIFTIPDHAQYSYKVKNVRISVSDKSRPLKEIKEEYKALSISKLVSKSNLAERIILGNSELRIPAHVLKNVEKISITALRDIDMPVLTPEMVNVTSGNSGYRFLPHGELFSAPAHVSLGFDENKIPEGYTPQDIKTYYFDTSEKRWIALDKDSLDLKKSTLISKTTHFTDMINGILKVPESPETGSYAPNSIKDIKAANPSEGIVSIAPPTANSMGSVTTSFPIKIPAGRQGMQPSLNISYNSESGNGWLGVGWDLSLPSITIDTRWGVPRYENGTETEIYTFGGEQLAFEVGNGTMAMPNRSEGFEKARQNDRRFYPRIEGSYNRIIRKGSNPKNYVWIVTSKEGTRSYFGGDENGVKENAVLKDDAGNIGYWALYKTVDLNKNYVEYLYDRTGYSGNTAPGAQQIYPQQINYTLHETTNTSQKYSVHFTTQTIGEDVQIDGRLGFLKADSKKLTNITISYGNSKVRSYQLNYKEGAFKKTLLGSITEMDANGAVFYTNAIEYEQAPNKIFADPIPWSVKENIDLSDKYSMLSGSSGTSKGANFGISVGAFTLPPPSPVGDKSPFSFRKGTFGAHGSISKSDSDVKITLIDIDGDHLPDRVYEKDGAIYYSKNKSVPGGQQEFGTSLKVGGEISTISKSKTSAWGVGINGNFSNVSLGFDYSNTSSTTHSYFMDFNNDGLVDFVKDGKVYFNRITAGIPSFHEDSSSTPYPVKITSSNPSQSLFDAQDAAEKKTMLEQNPLHDVVRVWVAPKTGKITVKNNFNLNQVTCPSEEDCSKADGVAVSFQYKNNDPLVDNINAGDFGMHSFADQTIDIKKGEKLYFRVTSKYDGTQDQVTWNPQITYSVQSNPALDSENRNLSVYKAEEDFVNSNGSTFYAEDHGTLTLYLNKPIPLSDDAIIKLTVNDQETALDPVLAGSTYSNLTYGSPVMLNKDDKVKIKVFTDTQIDWSKFKLIPEFINSNGDKTILQVEYTMYNDRGTFNIYKVSGGEVNRKISVKASSFPNFQGKNGKIVVSAKMKNKLLTKTVYTITNDGNTITPSFGSSYTVKSGDVNNDIYLETTISSDDRGFITGISSVNGSLMNNNLNYIDNPGTLQKQYPETSSGNSGILEIAQNNTSLKFEIVDHNASTWATLSLKDQNGNTTVFPKLSGEASFPKEAVVALQRGSYTYSLEYSENQNAPGYARISVPNGGSESRMRDFVNAPPHKPILSSLDLTKALNSDQYDGRFGTLYRGWGAFVLNGNNAKHNTVQEAYSLTANYANRGTKEEMKVIESELALSNAYGKDPGTSPPVNVPTHDSEGNVTFQSNESSMAENKFLMMNSDINNDDKGRWIDTDPLIYMTQNAISTSRIGVHGIDHSFDNYSTGQAQGDRLSAPDIKTKNQSVSVAGGVSLGGVAGINASHTVFSQAQSIRNVLDYNGDGFPDDFNKKNIKLTSPLGVPSSLGQDAFGIGNHQSVSSATAEGLSTGMNFTHGSSDRTAFVRTVATKSENYNNFLQAVNTAKESQRGSTKLTISGNMGISAEKSEKTFLDINGDGLPDLYNNGNFSLNIGRNQFANTASWNTGDVSKGKGFSTGAGAGVSLFWGSFEGGVNTSTTENETKEELLDINGDGLPDKAVYSGSNAKIYLNNGHTIGSTVLSVDAGSNLHVDQSISVGGNIGGTIPVLIPTNPTFTTGLKLNITVGVSVGKSSGKTKSTFKDMNGDGYPDFVTSDNANNIRVSLNQTGTANLLKKVITPMGGSWEVAYDRIGNTYEMPQSKFVLKSVITNDGFAGDRIFKPDVSKITVTYEKPFYSRWERTFYGFENLTVNQIDTKQGGAASNVIYRKTIQKFNNKNYYFKGLLLDEVLLDKDNKVWSKKVNVYSLKNIINVDHATIYYEGEAEKTGNNFGSFVAAESVRSNFYDGTVKIDLLTDAHIKKYTLTEFKTYDQWGNATEVRDRGDLDIGASEILTSKVTYTQLNNAAYIVMPTSVKNTAQGITREKKAKYSPANGNLINMTILNQGADYSVYDFEYDTYGNMTKSTGPANSDHQRFFHTYTYDDLVKTYPVKVEDAFGYTSRTRYDFRFGLPILTEDMNLQPMKYTYDAKARTTEITGPYEMFNNIPWTIKFEYSPITNAPKNATNAQSYAVTRHYDPEYAGNTINTITIVDGFGEAVQVKKTGAIHNEGIKYIVAGKVEEDAFGRALKTYYPTVENVSSANIRYNAVADQVPPTVNTYDVLDRVVSTKLPGEDLFSTISYGFANDVQGRRMFETTFSDELGSVKKTYTDIKGRTTSVHEVSNTGAIKTQFTHDAIGEILLVKDVNNNSTTSVYDDLGRRISYTHPDTGVTTYVYDKAGNMISKKNAANENVEYKYDFTRLKEVKYPVYPANNVKYYYGKALDAAAMDNNAVGRLWYQTDATGTQYLKYGRLGELIHQRRSVAVPGAGVYWFGTDWKYDTWNRVKSITYPDGEVLNYKYDRAGNLNNMVSVKDGVTYPMINLLGYDKFEQRVYLKNGNGTETSYEYETNRRRLLKMFAKNTNNNRFFMQNVYQYDVVSNVMQIHNNAPVVAGLLGGGTNYAFGYDDLYRLTSASGNWRGNNTQNQEERHRYTVGMTYDNMHNIMSKTQKHERVAGATSNNWTTLEPTSYRLNYKYDHASHPHAPSTVIDEQNLVPSSTCCNPNDPGVKFQNYTYDAKGNPTRIAQQTCTVTENKAIYDWDEENRLRFVDTNPSTPEIDGAAIYTYDAGGERIIKDVLYSGMLFRTADDSSAMSQTQPQVESHAFTIYPNGLLTMNVSSDGKSTTVPRYTKHYYAGSQRIISKIGEGNKVGMFNCAWQIIPFSGSTPPINTVTSSDTILQTATQSNIDILQKNNITAQGYGQNGGYNGSCTGTYAGAKENRQYWFHPDHLGSSSYITGLDGEVTQNIEYFPSGEIFVENHKNSHNSPYKFNAKEQDAETGYYYYGARYYNPRVSLWLNVDPLAEKMPSWSPYAYAFNNPIRFTDPDGREPKDDYKLHKNGRLELIKRTGGSFDRYYNESGSKSIKVNKEFTKNFKQTTEWRPYGQGDVPTETNVTLKNPNISSKQIKNYFYFLASNTNKEWNYDKLSKDGIFGNTTLYLITSQHRVGDVTNHGIPESYANNGYTWLETGHSHPFGSLMKESGYFDVNWPSGFNSNGTIKPGEGGDRQTFESNKSIMPEKAWIFLPTQKNPNIIYYNDQKFWFPNQNTENVHQ
ncbi:SpvB/TcaC N-terminal domain-containing protein [Chryseobacterium sp. MYb264]|uniref:SpvB/TcaC N-terminal domain-containing protein n=1 Tax=Chryseobacterium sp. MYb264 TaxID=2745153 RepID=UPI002E131853|nr:SpvB/TcaC N-terminal domain-containing protein [Chryseobacterium sp. MYb264]